MKEPIAMEDSDQDRGNEALNDRIASMLQKIAAPSTILQNSTIANNCCIFKVPQSLRKTNRDCYHPQVVSIGPYHHGEARLRMMEEYKLKSLGILLTRIESQGVGLHNLFECIRPVESLAREYYSLSIDMSCDEFIEMLVLDGCLVIEMFRKIVGIILFESHDPLRSVSWVFPFLLCDLILLENQVPFFVLQRLFYCTQSTQFSNITFSMLTLAVFYNAFQRPKEQVEELENLTAKHILDLLRSSFISADLREPTEITYLKTPLIQCISKLRRSGIKLRSTMRKSFLDVDFKNGFIYMPGIALGDLMSSFLQNCIAYEQQCACSKHITTYAALLDCLINTSNDVEYLSDMNIIENRLGTDDQVAIFINNLGKHAYVNLDECYLSKMLKEVDLYYNKSWNVQWGGFVYTYFQTPWSSISASAAAFLLVLAVIQTIYTILAYVRPASGM